jgi:uncharacterized protein
MKNRWLVVVVLLWFSASGLLAQQPAPADPAASKEDVQELFRVMNLQQQMLQVVDSMVKQQTLLMQETLKKRSPQISAAEIQQLDRTMREMMKEFPLEAMLNDMIPVYQKHLTKTDVGAMTTFYSSATGQKLLREMPAMTAESMQAAYPRMQAHLEKVMARIDEMARQEQQKKATPTTPKN